MRDWPLLTLATGPVDVAHRTLRDLSQPPLYQDDPAFVECFERTGRLLQQVFQTQYDVVIMQGEAILGLEAAAACLLSPGDKVLNLVSGVYGKWYEFFIEKYGGETTELAVPYNEAIDPEDVRRMLRMHPEIKFLSVVHCETPSGTLNPVDAIGAIAKEFGVVTIVDTVSGLGGTAFRPDAWGIDIAVAGPHKCLGGLPGLSLLSVSPAAWDAMERRDRPVRGSYLSLLDWKDKWITTRRFPHTPSVNEIYALESALAQVLEIGLERHIAHHEAVARACRAGMREMGLELWPHRDEIAASSVTAVRVPAGVTDQQLRGHMRERYGVMLAGSSGDLAGKVFVFGHMGRVAHPTSLAAGLAILERTLADLGIPVEFGAGVGAAMRVLADWDRTRSAAGSG